jgi:trk system potassium uptake protein TrkH
MLFFLMLAGACAGSTAGSVKMFRWFLGVKGMVAELTGVARPKAVRKIYYNKKMLDDNAIRRINGFFFIYIGTAFLGTLVLTFTGICWVEALGASLSAIGNVGPAIGGLGPYGNYAEVSVAAKWILSFLMMIGRLEIYTVLVLFIPWMWRK